MAPRPKSSTRSCRTAVAHKSDAAGFVQRLATIAGVPTPQLHIVDYDGPAAFAIGGSPFWSRIIISTDLCHLLTCEELTSVLAHEIAHIKQRDCLLMACITALTIVVVLFAALLNLIGYSLRRQGGFVLTVVGLIMAFAALIGRCAIAHCCGWKPIVSQV
jgi:heat shock protein HtpX